MLFIVNHKSIISNNTGKDTKLILIVAESSSNHSRLTNLSQGHQGERKLLQREEDAVERHSLRTLTIQGNFFTKKSISAEIMLFHCILLKISFSQVMKGFVNPLFNL